MWAGLVDTWSYEAISDSPLWNCMAHVRLNQTVEDYTKWIFGPPQMVSRDYDVWVVHMDSEMLDRTFLRLCEHYQARPGSEELLLAPLEQTAYGSMSTQVILAGPAPYVWWSPAKLFVLISADKLTSVELRIRCAP